MLPAFRINGTLSAPPRIHFKRQSMVGVVTFNCQVGELDATCPALSGASMDNLFTDSDPPSSGERLDVLLSRKNLVIERIISSARMGPTQYVQPQDEWVLLLRGDAELDVAGKAVMLKAGDHVFLSSGTAHTLKSASEGALWLAVHLHAPC
jgi:cupin 2 domain-containing protein